MTVRPADLQMSDQDGSLVATVSGEIDMSNAADLSQALISRLTNDSLGLILELSAVSYLDSAAIRALFEMRSQLADRGQRLQLVVPAEAPIATALSLSGVLEAMPVAETLERARRAIAVPISAKGAARP